MAIKFGVILARLSRVTLSAYALLGAIFVLLHRPARLIFVKVEKKASWRWLGEL